jgi:prepilin-type N-terminal cleavage/methylation domain-containing protein
MKRPLPIRKRRISAAGAPRWAFTLVEMLVVITIISILAGLITAAAVVARRRAKITAIVIEVGQLEMAMKAYKEKLGEYPPDFAEVHNPNDNIRSAAQLIVLRHLARAFPRYQPGTTTRPTPTSPPAVTGWNGLAADLRSSWGVEIGAADEKTIASLPFSAITFWLGGKPDWIDDPGGDVTLPNSISTKILSSRPIKGFQGFSANPTNPFDSTSSATSRIGPFFDFDVTRCKIDYPPPTTATNTFTFRYWPQNASGDLSAGALLYLRAENKGYMVPYTGAQQAQKFVADPGASSVTNVYPAMDDRLTTDTTKPVWINPTSFQIFSSGLDVLYTSPTDTPQTPYHYPSGINYGENTYDDITNFSGGTLEDKIPP